MDRNILKAFTSHLLVLIGDENILICSPRTLTSPFKSRNSRIKSTDMEWGNLRMLNLQLRGSANSTGFGVRSNTVCFSLVVELPLRRLAFLKLSFLALAMGTTVLHGLFSGSPCVVQEQQHEIHWGTC